MYTSSPIGGGNMASSNMGVSALAPLSNGSADDLRRRHYEDFVESDDDLRKEDIMFPCEPGS